MIEFKKLIHRTGMVLRHFSSFCRYILYKLGWKSQPGFKSKGERLIEAWLNVAKVKYTPQYKVVLNEIARNSNVVYIDFMLKIKGKKIAIEYNGRQHYQFVPFFHKNGKIDFEKQKHRDEIVRKWCDSKGIELIEIPYTMSCDEICDILKLITK